jgi:hypothetical protein
VNLTNFAPFLANGQQPTAFFAAAAANTVNPA